MRLIDADKLLETMETFLTKAENEARYTGRRGVEVTWNDAVYMIKVAPTIEPEIMADGTLHVTVNADVANIDRILLSQEGTHYGDLYYKDDEKPKRKTGKWINANDGKWNTVEVLKCSVCGEIDNRMYRTDNFCPNCGAKMEGGGQDEQA